jgi:hypothetical protein
VTQQKEGDERSFSELVSKPHEESAMHIPFQLLSQMKNPNVIISGESRPAARPLGDSMGWVDEVCSFFLQKKKVPTKGIEPLTNGLSDHAQLGSEKMQRSQTRQKRRRQNGGERKAPESGSFPPWRA